MADASPLMSLEDAVDCVRRIVHPGPTVEVALAEAVFHTLAEDVECDVDDPPFDRALMDGYAVRAADTRDVPVALQLVGQIRAGVDPAAGVGPGEAIQINTGAPIPPGADAVVRVEDTDKGDRLGRVLVRVAVEPGTFITPRATYVRAGATVLRRGTVITPLEIAVAASAGGASLTVFKRPTVAILVTGDELIDVDRRPTGAQIRNSNEYLLEALVHQVHGEPIRLGVVADDRETIRDRIEAGLGHDVLCITGGVSMGEFDFVPEVLRACGAKIHVHKIAIKPGRPTLFATAPGEKLIFALPGNPVSALVGFHLLVTVALARLQGRPSTGRTYLRATTRGDVPAPGRRRSFRPVRASLTADGRWEVEPLLWHGSGDPFGLAGANALVTRPAGAPPARPGDEVDILLLNLPE